MKYSQLTDKYRPRKFSDVIGQKVAVGTLEGMICSKKINPTIMLSGEYGTGKTTLARMVARYVNCATLNSCGTCKSCTTIDSGTNPDVIEINAANTRGIDDVREIIISSSFMPRSNYRVFIIDECFPYETHVMIDYDKSLPIGKIVENTAITHVLAYDLESKKIIRKKIVNRFSRSYDDRLIKITTKDSNSFQCTQKQEIYVVGKGYTPADEITPGDLLIEYAGEYKPNTVCNLCGFTCLPAQLSGHIMKYHRDTTSHIAYTNSRIGVSLSAEVKSKISKNKKEFYATPAGLALAASFSEKQLGSNNNIFKYMTPSEVSSLFSKISKAWRASLSEEEICRRNEIFMNAPKHKKLHPNNKETDIIGLNISGLKFVGNGKLFVTFTRDDGTLWRKNPDFIYKENNKVKKIIEVMDFEYWHTREEASDVIRYYKKLGYDCLVIDAARILPRNMKDIKGEIEAFINNHYTEVISTKVMPNSGTRMVYDLEVEDTHNFFVVPGIYGNGKDSSLTKYGKPVLVHNCQQITPQAAQALLKPLEEPPSKTLWLLCTTDPHKIPASVRSRCQQIKLQKVPLKNLQTLLTRVSEAEGLVLPETVTTLVANLADGHPRNALMLLEQVQHYVTAQGSVQENLEDVLPALFEELGSLPPEVLVSKYVQYLLDASHRNACKSVKQVENPEYFLHLSYKFIRDILYELTGVTSNPKIASFLIGDFKRHYTKEHLIKLLDLHLSGYMQAKQYIIDPADVLDLVVVKSLDLMSTVPLVEV